MKLSRRSVLRGSAVALAAPAMGTLGLRPLATPASAEPSASAPTWQHGLSLFGEVKYPAGFKHFDYVNPQAPKGGTVRMIAVGTFDNFNMAVSGVRGSLSAGLNLLYNSLMADAMDEVSTEYGLLAEAVRHPPDFSSVTYRLRAEARWHDGRPVSVDDVIFSLESFKKHHPQYAAYYRHVTKAEQTGEGEVTFTFDAPGNRELPQIVGQLYVLPKHWWQGVDANGNKRDIGATRLEAPLGCGPYRVKSFIAGRTVIYERV
jgi:microcin C transport system substrate-binding protein